jgi:hypothetical protein
MYVCMYRLVQIIEDVPWYSSTYVYVYEYLTSLYPVKYVRTREYHGTYVHVCVHYQYEYTCTYTHVYHGIAIDTRVASS